MLPNKLLTSYPRTRSTRTWNDVLIQFEKFFTEKVSFAVSQALQYIEPNNLALGVRPVQYGIQVEEEIIKLTSAVKLT